MSATQTNILIIDDSETDAMIMQEALSKVIMRNNIRTLNSATDAIDLFNQKEKFKGEKIPDLILLDLKMPELDGFEFLKLIKKDPRFIHIPIIVLSGSRDPEAVFKSYKLGANCFVQKPGDISKLQQIVAVVNEFWLGIAALPKS
ncbi:MAG: response regulator [Bdellovibrionales bacterium]